ncbi:hypothetical protein BDR07DRAFT_1491466 [Suillus spraguei]|nr:hypothetical protein BDR07DRAFT_1491466 [Suillus spraguei]
MAATVLINLFENTNDAISLFYIFGSASAYPSMQGLSWDPTVEQVCNGKDIQYKFTVGGKVFIMMRELATYGADSMVGRGTHVYDAMSVTNWGGVTSDKDKVKVQGTRSEYDQGFDLKDKSKRFYENRD